MSECSEVSLGLCLSEDQSKLTISDETGEAQTDKSLSVESLSLTKISAANTGIFTSEHHPVLITLPLGENHEKSIKAFERPPNFLSMTQHNTSTSGVTPSASTLEGTLDDIPDFQEMQPCVSVVVNKKEQEPESSRSPDSTPIKDSHNNQSMSPPSGIIVNTVSRERLLASESKFMQDVKRQNTAKPTSSIKSYASTNAPHTSTSGVTVVEVKPPPKPGSRVTGSDISKQTQPDHSIGSIKSDTMRDISTSVSSASITDKTSDLSLFQAFDPEIVSRQKPFLLHMPNDDELNAQNSHSYKRPRKILGDLNRTKNSHEAKPAKSWEELERRSHSISSNQSNSSSSHKHPSRVHKKKPAGHYMNENGIKQIVKEEMTAVVSMQNEIWHKILDSFVEKALKSGHPDTAPTAKQPPNKMVMLELPKEDPSQFYKPLKIPIVKSNGSAPKKDSGPMFFQFPSEDESIKEDITPKEPLKKRSSEEDVVLDNENQPVSRFDVSVQTTEAVEKTAECVEVGVQPDLQIENEVQIPPKVLQVRNTENLPIKRNLMRPLTENLEYQKVVNQQEIPLKVMEECKMLLESIQNSAKELREMRKDAAELAPVKETKKDDQPPQEAEMYIKSKHEIFLEKFFNEDSSNKQKKMTKFLDVVDLSIGTTSSGHFDLVKKSSLTKKPSSEFIHSVDITKEKRSSDKKRVKVSKERKTVVEDERKVHEYRDKSKVKPRNLTKNREGKPLEGLCTKDVFSPKKELSRTRSPIPSTSPPKSPKQTSQSADSGRSPAHCDSPPLSPGEISDRKSQSLSSIGKYLSQQSEDDNMSISDKTIENEELAVSEKEDALPASPPIRTSTPDQKLTGEYPTPLQKPASNASSEPYQPKPVNPSQFSQFIEENLSRIKQAYSETHQKEFDRVKKVNLLLMSRNTAQPVPIPSKSITVPSKQSSAAHPTKHLTTNTVTIKKPSQSPALPKPVIEHAISHRPESVGSMVSSDTSLPTNTDELLRAALDSDATLSPPDRNPTKLPKEVPKQQTKQKKTAHQYVSGGFVTRL